MSTETDHFPDLPAADNPKREEPDEPLPLGDPEQPEPPEQNDNS
ncbi:hypothetical protein N8H22_14875 [Stutzerimonas stutzeri]|nr:hypothetical protein [Stutzerimonas sp. S1]MCW3149886.1 hypothetical protein [Stutzerimonas sp. S1]